MAAGAADLRSLRPRPPIRIRKNEAFDTDPNRAGETLPTLSTSTYYLYIIDILFVYHRFSGDSVRTCASTDDHSVCRRHYPINTGFQTARSPAMREICLLLPH